MKVKVKIHADSLAVELTKQYFDYDPYNGMLEEELIEQLDGQLKTIAGCKEIISSNMEWINELLEERDAILDENSALNEKVRALEAELKNANELLGGYKK